MGAVRQAYLGFGLFFSAASLALLIAALVIPMWVFTNNVITDNHVQQDGLWGYRSCLFKKCSTSPEDLNDYPKNCFGFDSCEKYEKGRKIAQGGLSANAALIGIFMLYCLVKYHPKAKDFAETGCLGWLVLPFPLLGAIVGAVCWGLYFHYYPNKNADSHEWETLFMDRLGWMDLLPLGLGT